MVNMAVTPLHYKIPYIGEPSLTRNIPRMCHGLLMCNHGSPADGLRWFCSGSVDISTGWSLQKEKTLGTSFLQRDYQAESHLNCLLKNAVHKKSGHVLCNASKDSGQSQLNALDSYFGKLGDVDKPNSGDCASSSPQNEITSSDLVEAPFPLKEESKTYWRKLRVQNELRQMRDVNGQNSQILQNFDDTSELYLISVIASINIAVFLFEIASPVRNSDMDLFSLPLLYGAKINHLILTGEWWRLVTPMFLHSGVLHMALGCWALLTFGPKVCKGYGSFTFFLIYLLGGISGNLTSFLHTPDPTVGGTGPIFAMIGAWLIYQIQNKDMISKDISEAMFQKAILATALSFLLSNFGPIDDWTHLGAAITGVVYGYFTCPTLQMDDASSTSGQEEGITLVRQPADSCKSLLVFALLTLVLGSLVFFIEPPLGTLVTDDFV